MIEKIHLSEDEIILAIQCWLDKLEITTDINSIELKKIDYTYHAMQQNYTVNDKLYWIIAEATKRKDN